MLIQIISKEEYNYGLIRSYCKYPDNGVCTHPDTTTEKCNMLDCCWLQILNLYSRSTGGKIWNSITVLMC